ncbi:death-associated protein kinase [Paragonimus westermani]|uniref:Death-associated protein kinase n=1 Tax=Paragonimus westermani TaxID=34504 RepID=A0A5J4NZG9_9TREM|nr:death-associated protein kinase [Paragonimus westermani]
MIEMKEKPFVNQNSLDEVYEIREKIGDGHFADVNLCICRQSNKKFAAKFIMKQRFSAFNTYGEHNKGTSLANIDREAFILANLRHENIVKLHEVFHRSDSVVLILDLVTGGELFARVAECERLSEEEASNFVEQILYGVQHMHSLGVVHLDLKPENIMIEDLASRKIKIIDFGLARVLNPNETFQDMAGTPEFCGSVLVILDKSTQLVLSSSVSKHVQPHCVRVVVHTTPNTHRRSRNSQLRFYYFCYGYVGDWSDNLYSVSVSSILTGISPFAGDSQMETFQNILDCVVDYTREEIRDVTELAKDFIHRLLVRNPRKRATVNECLQHPWIKPCDSVQKDYRRGSVIRKQNLDGLKHFIAYPSPPSSPVHPIPNAENQSNVFCHGPQSQSTQTGLERSNGSYLDRMESEKNRQEHRRDKRGRRKLSHERNSHDGDVIELITPEEILPTRGNHSSTQLATYDHSLGLEVGNEQSSSRALLTVEQDGEHNEDVSRLDVQMPPAQTPTSSDTPTKQPLRAASNNKSHSGGWRSNFSNRLIGRLGAAFAAATITHSPSQASGGLDVGNKSGQNRINHVIRPKEMATTELPMFAKTINLTDLMFVSKVSHELTTDPLPSARHKKPLRRGLQLGTVSRAVKEFETSTDSDETNWKDSQNSPTNVGASRANKSQSVTETNQLKIWNAHNVTKVRRPTFRFTYTEPKYFICHLLSYSTTHNVSPSGNDTQ